MLSIHLPLGLRLPLEPDVAPTSLKVSPARLGGKKKERRKITHIKTAMTLLGSHNKAVTSADTVHQTEREDVKHSLSFFSTTNSN